MSTVLTPQHTINLEHVNAVDEVTITVKLDDNFEVVLESSQTDWNHINLEGNAVVNGARKVHWVIDDNRIKRIMIRPKRIQSNIWEVLNGRMFKWNENLNVKFNKTRYNDLLNKEDYLEWEYALFCELFEINGPVKMIDPIIRVNK